MIFIIISNNVLKLWNAHRSHLILVTDPEKLKHKFLKEKILKDSFKLLWIVQCMEKLILVREIRIGVLVWREFHLDVSLYFLYFLSSFTNNHQTINNKLITNSTLTTTFSALHSIPTQMKNTPTISAQSIWMTRKKKPKFRIEILECLNIAHTNLCKIIVSIEERKKSTTTTPINTKICHLWNESRFKRMRLKVPRLYTCVS